MKNKFLNITENLSLNFLNTRIVRNGKTIELINTPEDFLDWIINELANEEYKFQLEYLYPYFKSIVSITEILTFREYIYIKIADTLNGNNSFLTLQKWIESELESQIFQVKFFNNKRLLVPKHKTFEGFKSLIFFHLSNLIENRELEKLSCCENKECILIFINKTGHRKWCSMKICGNRSKVKRYERKNKL